MFDIRDYRMYKRSKRDKIYPQICDFWARQGFLVAQLAPFVIQGQSYQQKIGLRREFDLRMDDHKGNTYIYLNFRATLSDEGLLGGAAATIIFWPMPVVGGAVSYTEYENDARNLIGNFWVFMDQLTKTRGTMPQPPEPPETPEPEKPLLESTQCEYCGAFIITNWVVCPYCGNPIDEEEDEDEEDDEDDEDDE